MSVLEIICGIVMIIASLVIIAVIMLQESKQANGLDAVTGTSSSDNYLGRNGGNTKEAFFSKADQDFSRGFHGGCIRHYLAGEVCRLMIN